MITSVPKRAAVRNDSERSDLRCQIAPPACVRPAEIKNAFEIDRINMGRLTCYMAKIKGAAECCGVWANDTGRDVTRILQDSNDARQ